MNPSRIGDFRESAGACPTHRDNAAMNGGTQNEHSGNDGPPALRRYLLREVSEFTNECLESGFYYGPGIGIAQEKARRAADVADSGKYSRGLSEISPRFV